MKPRITVRYRIEVTGNRRRPWMLWRRVGSAPETGGDYQSEREAFDGLETAQRADKAAATRLGVDLAIDAPQKR